MRARSIIPFATLIIAAVTSAAAQDLPVYLRDRGTGVATSQFGSYVSKGELLVYPFFEWYYDRDLEYKPSELGYGLEQDHRGRYWASEGLVFFGYGVTPDVALELEAAVITAPESTSSSPASTRWST